MSDPPNSEVSLPQELTMHDPAAEECSCEQCLAESQPVGGYRPLLSNPTPAPAAPAIANLEKCMYCEEEATVGTLVMGCKWCFIHGGGFYHKECLQSRLLSCAFEYERRTPCVGCEDSLKWKCLVEHLDASVLEVYKSMKVQQKIPFIERTYCHDPACNSWISDIAGNKDSWIPEIAGTKNVVCTKCGRSTCTHCKKAAHNQDGDTVVCKSLMEQGQERYEKVLRDTRRWKLCPACARLVTRRHPSDGITCDNERCWTEFCWGCEMIRGQCKKRGGMHICPTRGYCSPPKFERETLTAAEIAECRSLAIKLRDPQPEGDDHAADQKVDDDSADPKGDDVPADAEFNFTSNTQSPQVSDSAPTSELPELAHAEWDDLQMVLDEE